MANLEKQLGEVKGSEAAVKEELEESKEGAFALKGKYEALLDESESAVLKAMLKVRAHLLKEFKVGKTESWDADKEI